MSTVIINVGESHMSIVRLPEYEAEFEPEYLRSMHYLAVMRMGLVLI